jgi:NAD(P)-dependent dehydrogenase (short-subunit alcohol dehydrogenase family)
LACGLARDGHRIAIHYRTSRAEAEATQRTIAEAGGDAAVFASPLSGLTDGGQLVRDVITHFGGLDTLVNNAGTFNSKSFDELTQAEWDAGWASTAGAAFYATRAALPHLRACGRGRIVNIGDALSDRPGFAEPAMSYYIGKTGVWMMTQTLANSEARHGLTANMVSPGVLEDTICPTPPEEMPSGRLGTHDEILRAVRFLLTDEAAAITATNLHVGDGWNAAPFFSSVLERAGYVRRK